MKNFLFVIAFLVVLTSIIVCINPQMHKPMNIGGAELVVQNDSNIKNTELQVENKDSITDKKTTTVTPNNTVKQVDNIKSKDTDINAKWEQLVKLQEQEDLAQQKALALAQQQKEEQAKKLALQNAQEKAQAEAKKKAEAAAKKQAEEQAKKLAQQKAQEEAKKKAEAEALAKKKAEEQKKLVEYQENILWNQWRANVCNNVANRLNQQFTSIAPVGTIYTYSFDVDNKRRITNISVRISKGYVNATTQQGVAMIYNAIQSLNLSTSLTYPSGSQRTTVKVSSGIERTSAQSKNIDAYSFNDIERVTKQKVN